MKNSLFFFAVCLLSFLPGFAGHPEQRGEGKMGPGRVIFDSDMGPDYDDVGAITLLHAYADSGYIRILATVASTNYEGVAGVLDVFNTWFNRPEIPIGVARANGLPIRDWQHWTDTLLANYPHAIQRNEQVPDATVIYRRVLAKQPDHSTTIVTVGFLTNLANLLRSPADAYSSLSGIELVRRKVRRLVSMAGKFPEGREFNIYKDAASSRYVFARWPTEVLFSGFEIGWKIRSGIPLIGDSSLRRDPVRDVFRICIPQAKEDSAGRMSWDETAVIVAARGYEPFYHLRRGRIAVDTAGANRWEKGGAGQAYLVEKMPVACMQEYINRLIMHQPRKK